ncbi:MAG TPA: lysylphosphatidylglycerol synthase transmembrane domain-containing protein [Clostridia bacterium]|nr:lysylphosphatidylglycerol synthase transmembrane domain-containing protein [Clostridia bacterium]
MNKKHALTTAIVVAVLGILVYFQFRTWTTFDWREFWRQTRGLNIGMLLSAVVLIYAVYLLRALRWKIFLNPTKKVSTQRLVSSQYIGFTGLALLGRPGEFVRPYLIALKEDLTFSSQLAVWAVERVFDMGTVALLLGVNLAIFGYKYKQFPQIEQGGITLLGGVSVIAVLVFAIWWKTERIAAVAEAILRPISKKFAETARTKVTSFGDGLHTIADARSFFAVLALSAAIWLMIAGAYWQVTHAYPATPEAMALHEMQFPDMLLVMAASMAGSIVQLPGVGGGSQLAVIGILSSHVFDVPKELAVSCGIMLWLITFVSVTPMGLLLAHRERISLREISAESEHIEHIKQ